MTGPLSHASIPSPPPGKTIDDLTTALSSFSRAHTPDPQVFCCCRRDDCEATRAWAGLRAKLESRLVLSAEVGQALLERYEAYVCRQEASLSRQASSIFSDDDSVSPQQHVEYLTKKLHTVTEENTLMESRLNDLMIKHEMADASTRTLMRELQESRSTVGRLSAQNARATGWEMRLEQMTQECNDMRQERDSEAHRARHAASKAAAYVEKCAKLQSEIHVLREEVHKFRTSRDDFSKNVLEEARGHLESFQHSLGRDRTFEDPETTVVLESLVADNETMKRDIDELQNLLDESREDVRKLREELEERRVSAPDMFDTDVTKVATPPQRVLYMPLSPELGVTRDHYYLDGDSSLSSPSAPSSGIRNHKHFLSSNTQILGGDTIAAWHSGHYDTTFPSLLHTRSPPSPFLPLVQPSNYSPSHHSGGLDPNYLALKPVFLRTHSRGVQTDPGVGCAYSSPRQFVDRDSSPATPAPESSDSSSINQQDPRSVGATLERVTALLLRLKQADVKTLTNRLKRQHLVAGDVGHLSRANITGILNEVQGLRTHAGATKDDVLVVTKSDSKALFKFFKDVFAELGLLRGQLNEIVLDPAMAHRLRKESIDTEDVRPSSAMGSWIAPIQKLFTHPTSADPAPSMNPEPPSAASKPVSDLGRGRAPARVAPKLGPAISATSTTVNVEFANTGVRRTDTSEGDQTQRQRVSSTPVGVQTRQQVSAPTALKRPIAVSYASSSRHLMGIFAGAPQPLADPSVGDRWVMIPKNEKDRVRHLKGAAPSAALRIGVQNRDAPTLGRSVVRTEDRLSRNVDAIIEQNDGDAPDFRETLLERTLRPRGLSDSSIRTTFLKGELSPSGEAQQHSDSLQDNHPSVPFGERAPGAIPPSTPASFQPVHRLSNSVVDRDRRERSPAARLGRSLVSWATAAAGGLRELDSDLLAGSPRDDSVLHAAWTRRGLEGRDY